MKNRLPKRLISSLLSVIMILLCCFISACNNNPPAENTVQINEIVTVEGGQIKGYPVEGAEEILAFKGIPYAAPPVGENRWRRPQPVQSWDGIKDCKEFGNSAMQPAQEVIEGSRDTEEFIVSNKNYSEDCLTLNVWAKGGSTTKNKPVLVYVHGGAWVAGGSSCEVYNGQNIAKEDVIFVSINYRLGIFGWFANSELIEEDEEGSAGNYGLMDIIKALEWVKDNIAAFGGDGNNITLMGQSAGSNLVQFVMVSPKAQGLIKNVVACSHPTMDSAPASVTTRAAACDGLGTLAELRALSAEELEKKYESNFGLVLSAISVCNDGVYVDSDLGTALKAGRASNVNLITGMVWDKEENNGNNDSQFSGPAVNGLSTGELLMANLNAEAKARREGDAKGKTYLYTFAHPLSGPNTDKHGAFHTSDIPHFLNYRTPLRNEYWTDDDIIVGKIMSSYLINFCKTGNPNGEGLVSWKPNSGNYKYMLLQKNCEMKILSAEQITSYENATAP